MHACGHDFHIAMALGAGKILKAMEKEFCGSVKLIFQPSEEMLPGGAVKTAQRVAAWLRRRVGTGTPYAMSKAAMMQMTRTLASEWGPEGIRVNSVAPWYIRTPLASGVLGKPDYLAAVVAHTPLGRVGEPEEAAAAVAFLCMDEASYITGACIPVDGGFLARGFSPP